jgi:hypothetical protein
MSLNQLIEDTNKPWLNVRVNNLTVDGVLAGVPTVSLSTVGDFTVAGLPPADANNVYRCYVTRVGKLYTFVFHIKTDGVTIPGAFPAVITISPAGLAKIPGYKAKNVNLEETASIFKYTARPGGAGVLFGIRAIQNTSTFWIVRSELGSGAAYTWAGADLGLDLSCTISVEAE